MLNKKEYMREYRIKNRDKIKIRKSIHAKEYYKNNREKIIKKSREYAINNRDKTKERAKRYYIKNRENILAHHKEKYNSGDYNKNQSLKNIYGITLEQYEQMRVSQNNKCAICDNTLDGYKNCHVDHNHITGKTRQLLCKKCNVGIGWFDDNPLLLEKAIAYLKKWNGDNETT